MPETKPIKKSAAALNAPFQDAEGTPTRMAGPAMDRREAILRHVCQQIQNGQWKLNERIPTESQLARQFGASKSLVNQTLKLLENQGILKRYRRKGTFVARMASMADASLNHVEKSQNRQVHIIAPVNTTPISMHWNHGTLNQLEVVLNASGLQMVHVSVPAVVTPQMLGQTVNQLASDRSHGLLILHDLLKRNSNSPPSDLMDYALQLQSYPGRVCWLNRTGVDLTAWPYDAVSFSPLQQGVMVGQYLIQNNVKRVICMVMKHAPWSRMRVEGVGKILGHEPAPIPMDSFDIDQSLDAESPAMWQDVLEDILTHQDRPTVVVPNDIFAARMIDAAARHGLSCPKDFCVVSFDNYEPCRPYNITTTAPMATHLGEAVGMLFCDRQRHPANTSVHLNIRSVIIERCTFTTAP